MTQQKKQQQKNKKTKKTFTTKNFALTNKDWNDKETLHRSTTIGCLQNHCNQYLK